MEQVDRFHAAFRALDEDHNGWIDLNEFMEAIGIEDSGFSRDPNQQ
jgi:Ca2+-binding EF-hand superfamily protein